MTMFHEDDPTTELIRRWVERDHRYSMRRTQVSRTEELVILAWRRSEITGFPARERERLGRWLDSWSPPVLMVR